MTDFTKDTGDAADEFLSYRSPVEVLGTALRWLALNPEAVIVAVSAAYIVLHLGAWGAAGFVVR